MTRRPVGATLAAVPLVALEIEPAQGNLAPEALVDSCLDLVGPVEVRPPTHRQLVEHVAERGEIRWDGQAETESSTERVGELLQLIASVKEYQYC